MTVIVNGEEKQFPEQTTLAEIIRNLELPALRIAVELNQMVVRRTAWDEIIIRENDAIEIVHFVGGGSLDFGLAIKINFRIFCDLK